MTSIFEKALGSDFQRLHPIMRRRFSIGLESGQACIGQGVMTVIRHAPWWTVPFLHLGGLRNILIPDAGSAVAFTIENYPYRDPFGRETITFVRQYTLGRRPRRFDATMILEHGRVVDYLGTHQRLAVDLDPMMPRHGGNQFATSPGPRGMRVAHSPCRSPGTMRACW